MKINNLSLNYKNFIDEIITLSGWIQTIRKQKDIFFIKLNDGSDASGVQLICQPSDILSKINIGTSIQVKGKVVVSPATGQTYEIIADDIQIYGYTDINEYPLAKGRMPLEYLRNYQHLRFRTLTFGSVFRIKSSISYATHKFFRKMGYLHINPNIITINECEGGAGVFQLTEHDMSNHNSLPIIEKTTNHDWNKDHFSKPAYLTVSSQLQLEAPCCSLGPVYTTNKSFRSEHSSTNKHLSEFEHLEIEDAFITLDELMKVGENYVKYVCAFILEKNKDDLDALNKFVSKGIIDRLVDIIVKPFTRIKYLEAIELLSQNNIDAKINDDISSEMEQWLVRHFNAPVFITHWPQEIKSFYMKQCDDGTCENFDLIMPYKVGELIGGSIREDNYEKLVNMMNYKNIDPKPLEFYLDLRKYGSVPHGGFGLGLDRMCMMVTGMENIKDVVAFPVCYQSCNY